MPGRWGPGLLAVVALCQAALAAGPAWTLSCKPDAASGKLACLISQQLTFAETRSRLLTVEVVPARTLGNADATIRLSLPHGVRLDAMVGLRVDDGKLFKLPLQSSDADGLYTTQPLGGDMVDALQKGSELTVSLVLSDGRLLDVPASLAGFSLAYEAAQRAGG